MTYICFLNDNVCPLILRRHIYTVYISFIYRLIFNAHINVTYHKQICRLHVQAKFGINLRWTTLNIYENREKTSGVWSSVRVGTGCCVCMQLRKHLTNVKYNIEHLYVL